MKNIIISNNIVRDSAYEVFSWDINLANSIFITSMSYITDDEKKESIVGVNPKFINLCKNGDVKYIVLDLTQKNYLKKVPAIKRYRILREGWYTPEDNSEKLRQKHLEWIRNLKNNREYDNTIKFMEELQGEYDWLNWCGDFKFYYNIPIELLTAVIYECKINIHILYKDIKAYEAAYCEDQRFIEENTLSDTEDDEFKRYQTSSFCHGYTNLEVDNSDILGCLLNEPLRNYNDYIKEYQEYFNEENLKQNIEIIPVFECMRENIVSKLTKLELNLVKRNKRFKLGQSLDQVTKVSQMLTGIVEEFSLFKLKEDLSSIRLSDNTVVKLLEKNEVDEGYYNYCCIKYEFEDKKQMFISCYGVDKSDIIQDRGMLELMDGMCGNYEDDKKDISILPSNGENEDNTLEDKIKELESSIQTTCSILEI